MRHLSKSARLGLLATAVIVTAGINWEARAARGPVVLSERECLTLQGGADCNPGDANCGCITGLACPQQADCGSVWSTSCVSDGGTGCVKLVLTNQANCGAVNNSFPKGCTNTISQKTKCAVKWTGPIPQPYNDCTYPAASCYTNSGMCGAQLTTCNQL